MNRRSFLRGLGGVTVGLPVLRSLQPRSAWGGTPKVQPRFIVFFTCNGVNMDTFWPTHDYGALSASSFAGDRATSPLADWAHKVCIPRGIFQVPRGFGWDGGDGCDHNRGTVSKLTCQHPSGSTGYALGISVDQLIAQHINAKNNPALVLQVGSHGDGGTGYCSFTSSETPAVGENNPWLVYQDLFGLDDLEDKDSSLLMARRTSVLDLVREEYKVLMAKDLSTHDRNKLDAHFSAIRDLETKLESSGCVISDDLRSELESVDPDTVGYDDNYKQMGELQMQLLALAIACGKTNVATLQWDSGAGGPQFTWDGMDHQYNHHKLSHGNTKDDCSGDAVPGYEDMLTDIDRWYSEQYATLLSLLDSFTDEDGGTVLDNSVVLWANELSHGLDHDWRDLPFIYGGSAGGKLVTGEYIKVTEGDQWGDETNTRNDNDAATSQLYTTIMNAVGCTNEDGSPIEVFGDPAHAHTGEFDELKA